MRAVGVLLSEREQRCLLLLPELRDEWPDLSANVVEERRAFVLAVLRYAVFADRGTAGEPEDVVLGDRALALIGLVWAAMYALAVADW